jgi:hypothetical protein
MFGRGKSGSAVEAPEERPGAKNRPTTKRSVAQARNRRPLVPDDRKTAGRGSREQMREQRIKTRQAMLNGDERYLPARDQGPQKRFVRDFVDARWNFGEVLLPVLVIVLVISFTRIQQATVFAFILMYGLVLLVFLDCMWMLTRLRRALRDRFGAAQRGLGLYAILRSAQIRRWRMPRPMVTRGQQPR